MPTTTKGTMRHPTKTRRKKQTKQDNMQDRGKTRPKWVTEDKDRDHDHDNGNRNGKDEEKDKEKGRGGDK
jgi:hypothetical protein